MAVSGVTTTVFSPSLYLIVSVWPSIFCTANATVPFVMVLVGPKSHARCPSPVPRIDSGKICTSVARKVPPGCGTAVVPTKLPGLMSANDAATIATIFALLLRWMLRRAPPVDLTVSVLPSTWTMVPLTLGFTTTGGVAPALGACWANATGLNVNATGLNVSVPKAATRSHFLTLDCMGLLSEIVLVDDADEGAPERAPERPSSLYACIPLVAAIFPISPFAGPDGGKAFDRFNLHYIFGHFIAQLPLDPQPQRSPMRHLQRRVVHFVGEQSLRVESVLQPDALVIL